MESTRRGPQKSREKEEHHMFTSTHMGTSIAVDDVESRSYSDTSWGMSFGRKWRCHAGVE